MVLKHTPGPWNVAKHATPDYAPRFGIYGGESARDLAIVMGENAKANAALIAAAPDLLTESIAMLHELETGRDFVEYEKRKNALKAAIAKATGQ